MDRFRMNQTLSENCCWNNRSEVVRMNLDPSAEPWCQNCRLNHCRSIYWIITKITWKKGNAFMRGKSSSENPNCPSRTKEFLQQKKTMAWNVSLNLEGFVFLFLRKCEKRLCSIWTWYPRTNTIQMNVLTIKLNGNVWMTDALIRSQRSWVSS